MVVVMVDGDGIREEDGMERRKEKER